jgi:hypothetical protein
VNFYSVSATCAFLDLFGAGPDVAIEYLRSRFNVLGMPRDLREVYRAELGRVTSAGEGDVIESSEYSELIQLLKGWGKNGAV